MDDRERALLGFLIDAEERCGNASLSFQLIHHELERILLPQKPKTPEDAGP